MSLPERMKIWTKVIENSFHRFYSIMNKFDDRCKRRDNECGPVDAFVNCVFPKIQQ